MVLHFSAFAPRFKLSHLPFTDETIIFDSCKIGKKTGLKYVFPGNTYPSEYDNTYCECGELLIKRDLGNKISNYITEENKCPSCGKYLKKIIV